MNILSLENAYNDYHRKMEIWYQKAQEWILFTYNEIAFAPILPGEVQFFSGHSVGLTEENKDHYFQVVNHEDHWLLPFDIYKIADMLGMKTEESGFYEIMRAAVDYRIIQERRISKPTKRQYSLPSNYHLLNYYEDYYLIVDRALIIHANQYSPNSAWTLVNLHKLYDRQIKQGRTVLLKFDTFTNDETYQYDHSSDQWNLVFEGPGFA